MSANNRMVCIVDDDLEITILFREALKTLQELQYLHLQIPFWH
jgi:hypothetical protein